MLKLAIVLVLYHSRDEVEALYDCLQRQTFQNWELIAVDNHAADGAGAYLAGRGDPRIRLLVNAENVGFARAVNRGLRAAAEAGAQRCMLLNPDVEFGPEFLADLTAKWNATGARVIGPRIMYAGRPDVSWYAGGDFVHGWIFSNRHFDYDPAGPDVSVVQFVSGCCVGIETAVLREVGLLDESFFVYSEDADFCLRLNRAGIPLHYVATPFLLHHAGASSGGERNPAGVRLYFHGYAILLRKHLGWATALLMCYRTAAKEFTRPQQAPGHGWRVARALLRGLLVRLKPVPTL